jgi:hypothetical protein
MSPWQIRLAYGDRDQSRAAGGDGRDARPRARKTAGWWAAKNPSSHREASMKTAEMIEILEGIIRDERDQPDRTPHRDPGAAPDRAGPWHRRAALGTMRAPGSSRSRIASSSSGAAA